MAALAASGMATPFAVLALIFMMGTGSAFMWPAWQAAMSGLVQPDEVEAAASLNNLSFNIAATAGPALGGALFVWMGAAPLFLFNALSFGGLLLVYLDWIRSSGRPQARALAAALNQHMARSQALIAQQRQFLDDASHQLRTHLTTLQMQIDCARRELDSAVVQSTLEALGAEISRATRSTQQLLALGRSDTAALDCAPTDLAALLRSRFGTVIIGAGPTGLSAAYHLGGDTLLLERNPTVGGWCRSIRQNGFTFDHAGHIMFSNDPYVLKLYDTLLGDNQHWQMREAWIYSKQVYTRYPFQGALHGLPSDVIKECIVGAIEARYGKAANEAAPQADANTSTNTSATAVANAPACQAATAFLL
eukprot:gene44042-54729_t